MYWQMMTALKEKTVRKREYLRSAWKEGAGEGGWRMQGRDSGSS
jgi:hypothetical protein